MPRTLNALNELRDWLYGLRRQAGALLPARRILPAANPGCATPVLLLPGIAEPGGFLRPLGRYLAGHGHPVHFVPRLGLNLSRLDESARIVAATIARLRLDRVVLVAHSKGGLVGKATMTRPDCAAVAGLVAVGSPFAGADFLGPLHRIIPLGRPVAELTRGHAALARLAANRDVNARIASLAPAWDQVVAPESTVLPGATNITLSAGGHFGSLNDPSTRRHIHQQIHRLLST